MGNIEKVKDEYPETFCSLLEVAYGRGFLSEGGTDAVDDMVRGHEMEIEGKRLLEIGCGYGGATQHLARRFQASVDGVEINHPMVDEANRRVPVELRHRVRIVYYDDVRHLPFSDASFDFAYAKEVLLHLDRREKEALFKEVARVLKPGSCLVLLEWLSPTSGSWGPRVQAVAEADGLTLQACTEQEYVETANNAGLELVSMVSRSREYAAYNREIASYLGRPDVLPQLQKRFADEYIRKNICGYETLSEAMAEDELQVRSITFKSPLP
jgi:phosphoethanolamine N-methyltransferase